MPTYPQIGDICTLNDIDLKLARKLARSRNQANEQAGIQDAQITKDKSRDIHLEGACCETAVAKLLNVYPDTTTTPRSKNRGTDFKGDLSLPSGHTLDVKCIRDTGHRLIVKESITNPPDIFGLFLRLSDTQYQVMGFISANSLLQKTRLRTINGREVYCAQVSELQSLEQVIKELEEHWVEVS